MLPAWPVLRRPTRPRRGRQSPRSSAAIVSDRRTASARAPPSDRGDSIQVPPRRAPARCRLTAGRSALIVRRVGSQARKAFGMKREHGAAYPSGAKTVAAPATVSGEAHRDEPLAPTGAGKGRWAADPRARRPAGTSNNRIPGGVHREEDTMPAPVDPIHSGCMHPARQSVSARARAAAGGWRWTRIQTGLGRLEQPGPGKPTRHLNRRPSRPVRLDAPPGPSCPCAPAAATGGKAGMPTGAAGPGSPTG